jgi:hypothetical protein
LSFKNNEFEFEEYLNQLSHQVTFPYGETYDTTNEISEYDDESSSPEDEESSFEVKLTKNTKSIPLANPYKKSKFFTGSLLNKQNLVLSTTTKSNLTTNTPTTDTNKKDLTAIEPAVIEGTTKPDTAIKNDVIKIGMKRKQKDPKKNTMNHKLKNKILMTESNDQKLKKEKQNC